jgi:hypothetical protein
MSIEWAPLDNHYDSFLSQILVETNYHNLEFNKGLNPCCSSYVSTWDSWDSWEMGKIIVG